ncbi:GNAT family N-acetyltransferase [Vibrio maerlii]|uniref:GNAT family N-acetyltransferase n=1 Tax=Vibrio maerlii TaxID=2231648 RepID=UPI000E3BA82D|nr:GNAT family N-acetyltransferase [Vibrio maerlii]
MDKKSVSLISPSIEFESQFADFYLDFVKNDPENADYYKLGFTDFELYIHRLQEEEAGQNLKAGYVPCSHFWLINQDKAILGALRVRHNIDTDFLAQEAGHIGYDVAPSWRRKGAGSVMLSLSLPEAAELGIEEALITADVDNLGSRGVIEANGGELENIIYGPVFESDLARYWVSTAPTK